MQNSKNNSKKNTPKKVNNGEGVKAAFENAIKSLPTKFEKLWAEEKGKKYLTHLMFAFLPASKKEVFRIGKFSDHNKFENLPKICSLTGFAVSDSSFAMDEVTKKFFSEKGKKVNKLVHAIICFGSTESNKILSEDALLALNNWVLDKITQEAGGVLEGNEFNRIITSAREKAEGKGDFKKKKPMHFDNPRAATHTLSDKYDFDSLKNQFTKKGVEHG